MNRSVPGLDGNRDVLPVFSFGTLQWQIGRYGKRVLFLLPAFAIDRLREITLVVEQSHSHQRDTQVRCTLEMVTRQHTETAGIDTQRFVQAELRREVGSRSMAENAGMGIAPSIGRLHVFSPAAVGPVDAGMEHRLASPLLELIGRIFTQQKDWVVRSSVHRTESISR